MVFIESSNYNLRLQRLDRDGNALWPDDGIIVSDEPQDSWLTDYDLTVDPSVMLLLPLVI